jgi:hypothetical protein
VDGEARFEELCDDLLARHGDVERAKMTTMRSPKRNGNLVARLTTVEDTTVFELADPAGRETALALDGARPSAPRGRGRPLEEWIVAPPPHAARWEKLAAAAPA